MGVDERQDVDRKVICNAMMDAVDVIGGQKCLRTLITALSTSCQGGSQNWRQIEALLFAMESISSSCRKCKDEMVAPLMHVLGAVPEAPVVQAAMCSCLATFAAWLPSLVDQTGTDPVALLLPVLLRNMTNPDWASPAVDAFYALCKSCRSHLPAHAGQLMEMHQQIIHAANAMHQWAPVGSNGFLMKESEAMLVTEALCHGITRTGNAQVAAQFINTVSEAMMHDLRETAFQTTQNQTKLIVLVSRVKAVFRNCGMETIAAQLLSKFQFQKLR